MRLKENQLTKNQQIFLEYYIKTNDGIGALNKAYPKSIKWTKNAQHVEASRLIKNPKIMLKIQQHNDAEAKKLVYSTTLNKKKILNEIINQYQQTAENGASERTNSVALLKLMAQISKLLDNNPVINNNIQINNNTMNNINNFLDL